MFGTIKKWFEKPDTTPADLSVLHTDIHSHLLFGIDDGAQQIDDSMQLIEELHHLGYRRFIATPHIMSDFYRNSPETILPKLEAVRAELANRNMGVTIEAAAEYYLDFDFQEKVNKQPLLTFGDRYVLFELSFMNPPDNLNSTIFDLQTKGYKPVLAHPERYLYWMSKMDKFEELRDKGVWFQINLLSIVGHYGPPCKKLASEFINRGWFELLGTDLHSMKHIDSIKKGIADADLKKILASGKLRNASF